jgi:hypothetical protein
MLRIKTPLALIVTGLVAVGWAWTVFFSTKQLGLVWRVASIVIASVIASLAIDLIRMVREYPNFEFRALFNRQLLITVLRRMGGILVMLAAIEAARAGEGFVKLFFATFFAGLLLLQIVRMRKSVGHLFAALVGWAGTLALFLGIHDVIPYGRQIGLALLAIAILVYVAFAGGNHIKAKV